MSRSRNRIDFLMEHQAIHSLSDPEIERIKQEKLREMIEQQSRPKTQPVTELNMENFDSVISADKHTLVDFWAEWCGPCKTMHPVFESLSKKYPHVRFARLNVDSSQGVASRYSVSSIPTFIMFRGGKILDRMTGAVGAPGIHMICQKHQ